MAADIRPRRAESLEEPNNARLSVVVAKTEIADRAPVYGLEIIRRLDSENKGVDRDAAERIELSIPFADRTTAAMDDSRFVGQRRPCRPQPLSGGWNETLVRALDDPREAHSRNGRSDRSLDCIVNRFLVSAYRSESLVDDLAREGKQNAAAQQVEAEFFNARMMIWRALANGQQIYWDDGANKLTATAGELRQLIAATHDEQRKAKGAELTSALDAFAAANKELRGFGSFAHASSDPAGVAALANVSRMGDQIVRGLGDSQALRRSR